MFSESRRRTGGKKGLCRKDNPITYKFTLLAGLPLGVLQALLVTADGNDTDLLLERVADGAGADLSVLQVAVI